MPPLLIASINYMKHIPKAEAQGLAQETAVLGLVVVKQGPVAQVTMGQGLAKDPRKDVPGTPRASHMPDKGSEASREWPVAHTKQSPVCLRTKSSGKFPNREKQWG